MKEEKEEMEQEKQQKNKGRWCKILFFSHISTEATVWHQDWWSHSAGPSGTLLRFTDCRNTSYYGGKESKAYFQICEIFSIYYFWVKRSKYFFYTDTQITWIKLLITQRNSHREPKTTAWKYDVKICLYIYIYIINIINHVKPFVIFMSTNLNV